MDAAYRQPKPAVGKWVPGKLIDEISTKVPQRLGSSKGLGMTLKRTKSDVLAYFDHIGSSNGPTEAINGRLGHLRGSALGFRKLAQYIASSLLESGGFRPVLHP